MSDRNNKSMQWIVTLMIIGIVIVLCSGMYITYTSVLDSSSDYLDSVNMINTLNTDNTY